MIIALDFDGTCVTHEYPKIGKDIGAVPVLKSWVERGHKLILWTMRSGRGWSGDDHKSWSKELVDAINWFGKNDIPLYGINENPEQSWSSSPKAYAHLYIDDAALGCPIKIDKTISDRPFVSWPMVDEMVKKIEIGKLAIGHTTLIGGTN